MTMDKQRMYRDLEEQYRRTRPRSWRHYQDAVRLQVLGGSHNLRLFSPFPFYDSACSGSHVWDIDGFSYIDFWQGHFGNILGHNPPVVLNALRELFGKGQGLATGFPGTVQKELAALILDRLGGGIIRFTTSGALASMYAIMLSRAHTDRSLVCKIGGGWHGAQPYALKGISAFDGGLTQVESAGLPKELNAAVVMSEFNSISDLEDKFARYGDRIACLIMEPFIGAGGFIFGTKEYIRRARELTQDYGAVLILDEVISGFRFHAGPLQTLYGIQADLTIFGKAIGGGMPLSALAGRPEIMELCGPDAPPAKKVKFEGGTFSAHPACLLAGLRFLEHLVSHEEKIYPHIGRLGEMARSGIEDIFARNGFRIQCTGAEPDIVASSSVIGVHFLRRDVGRLCSPEQVWDPGLSDFELRERIFKLAMLLEGFFTFHGYGTLTFAHTEGEVQASLEAAERIAERWNKDDVVVD